MGVAVCSLKLKRHLLIEFRLIKTIGDNLKAISIVMCVFQ